MADDFNKVAAKLGALRPYSDTATESTVSVYVLTHEKNCVVLLSRKRLLLDLFFGLQHVVDDRLHAAFVGERRQDVRLQRHDRLAVVGLPVAIGQRDHHAVAGQGFGVHALENAAVVFVVREQLVAVAGSLRSRSLTLNVSMPSG